MTSEPQVARVRRYRNFVGSTQHVGPTGHGLSGLSGYEVATRMRQQPGLNLVGPTDLLDHLALLREAVDDLLLKYRKLQAPRKSQ
jgi:hypothetical protein